MRIHLLNRNEVVMKPVWNWETLKEDLTLEPLLQCMSIGDETINKSVGSVLSSPLTENEAIRYRQAILEDCLQNSKQVRSLYTMVADTVERQKQSDLLFGAAQTATQQFEVSRKRLELLVESLRALRTFSDIHSGSFNSEGFHLLFADWNHEFDHRFFEDSADLLSQLSFERGMLIGASLSGIGRSIRHRLLLNHEPESKWKQLNAFRVKPEDSSATEDLLHRREVAESSCNRTLSKAALNIAGYFEELLRELAFYIGCLNFAKCVVAHAVPFCIPALSVNAERETESLYELGVVLSEQSNAVGNSFNLPGKHCVVITGADLGGKSTFLRSVGQSQLMMQCGMPVAAKQYTAPVVEGIYTHFLREEDRTMKNGKLNEELTRMSRIADHLTAGSVILLDESFCSTNEREGSEISRQIVQAFMETGVDMFMVTHLYRLAKTLYDEDNPAYGFLIAERLPDGQRTKNIISGMPLPTGYGKDLYNEVFGKQTL